MKALLFLLALIYAVPAHSQELCVGCDAAKVARGRTVVGSGPPDPGLVCVDVAMSDNSDSVSVTISYPGKGDKIVTFPKGAAQRMSGDDAKLMICVQRSQLRGANLVRVVPGSGETCAVFRPVHVQLLLTRGKPSNPACLRKECNPAKS